MTEASPRSRRPWLSWTGRELRLAIVTALAGVYLAVWPRLGVESEASEAAPPEPAAALAVAPPAPLEPSQEVTWIDQLPVAQRPPFGVPEGWVLADRHASPRQVAPAATSADRAWARPRAAPVRVAATRARRIRTRSS